MSMSSDIECDPVVSANAAGKANNVSKRCKTKKARKAKQKAMHFTLLVTFLFPLLSYVHCCVRFLYQFGTGILCL